MSVLALLLLLLMGLVAVPLSGDLPALPRMRLRAGIVLIGAGLTLGATALLALNAVPGPPWAGAAAPVLAGFAAAAAGGPVVTATLRLADDSHHGRTTTPAPAGPASAGTAPVAPLGTGPADPRVLTGGAWIGVLERLAVAASLLSGLPEGIVAALGVKGLGRYPELRDSAAATAAAERFIIGTFASVLWAAACAGIGLALRN